MIMIKEKNARFTQKGSIQWVDCVPLLCAKGLFWNDSIKTHKSQKWFAHCGISLKTPLRLSLVFHSKCEILHFLRKLSHIPIFCEKETRQAFKPTIPMSFQETSYPHFKTRKWRFKNWSYLTFDPPLRTQLSKIPILNYLRTCWGWDLIKHWVDPVTKEGGRESNSKMMYHCQGLPSAQWGQKVILNGPLRGQSSKMGVTLLKETKHQ